VINLVVDRHRLSKIKLIIFDKDGTLTDLNRYWIPIARLRAKIISRDFGHVLFNDLLTIMGVDYLSNRLLPNSLIGSAKRKKNAQTVVDFLSEHGIDVTIDCILQSFHKADNDIEHRLNEIIQLTPGVKRVLSELKVSGCQIAIATNDNLNRTEFLFKYLKINQYIDWIMGADQVKRSKPYSEMVDNLLEISGSDPDETVIIGDSLMDIEMGINAGVKASIGVTCGNATYEELFYLTPYVIPNLDFLHVDNSSNLSI